jgi:hypothetical protein
MIQKKVKVIFCAAAAGFAAMCFSPANCQAGIAAGEQISALRLNGVSWENISQGVTRLKITADGVKAGALEPLVEPEEAGRRLMDFFILGLNIREDKFWANLTPGEPDNIIDPELAATALGEVLLRADLRLKKDFCELTNPQLSSIGRKYWDALSEKAAELGIKKIPAMNRIWIAPEEAAVNESKSGIYITESRLKVCLKANYPAIMSREPGSRMYGELAEYAGQLLKDIILPELDKRVNESFVYADLRQVNQALILARWYKNKFGAGKEFSSKNSLTGLIRPDVNAGLLKKQIYDDYMDSLSNGEYVITGPSGWSGALDYLRPKKRYVSGGVDLRKSPARVSHTSAAARQGRNTQYVFSMDLSVRSGIYSGSENYAESDLVRIGNNSDKIDSLTLGLPEIPQPNNSRNAETDINKDVTSAAVLYSL